MNGTPNANPPSTLGKFNEEIVSRGFRNSLREGVEFVLFRLKLGWTPVWESLIWSRVSLKLKDNASKLGHFEVYRAVRIGIMTGRPTAGLGNTA